jgi:dethiobiotin synthetase
LAGGCELALDEVNPLWFPLPIAPLAAARAENREVSIPALADWFRRVSSGRVSVIVEGAGGWLTPVAKGASVGDLCAALALPVIIVVANRLGCLNHTLLTIESIRARGLECRGIILNTIDPPPDESSRTNLDLLKELASVPILLEISPGQSKIELAVA